MSWAEAMDTTWSQLSAMALAGRRREAARDLRTMALMVAVAGGKDSVRALVKELEQET